MNAVYDLYVDLCKLYVHEGLDSYCYTWICEGSSRWWSLGSGKTCHLSLCGSETCGSSLGSILMAWNYSRVSLLLKKTRVTFFGSSLEAFRSVKDCNVLT